jgi:toxin ParE1/3/4
MHSVRPEALRDVAAAARWYNKQEKGLGWDFLGEIEAVFNRIEKGSKRYRLRYGVARKALCRRFPYAIYFRIDGPDTVILAVLHQRRNLEPLGDRFG